MIGRVRRFGLYLRLALSGDEYGFVLLALALWITLLAGSEKAPRHQTQPALPAR